MTRSIERPSCASNKTTLSRAETTSEHAVSHSIPRHCLQEDLAQLVMGLEDALDDMERMRAALSGLECCGFEEGVSPEDDALLNRVAEAKAALPHVREAMLHDICGPLSQDIRRLAHEAGNASWRILEEDATWTTMERRNGGGKPMSRQGMVALCRYMTSWWQLLHRVILQRSFA